MRHNTKRPHDIDIKPALSGETKQTSNRWTEKEPVIRQDFIWEAEPTAIETFTKGKSTQTPTQSTPKTTYNFSKITTCLNATPITAAETSSGQNKKKTKHQKTTGGNFILGEKL